MKADVRKAGDVIIVDLDGDLTAGLGDEILKQVMNELVAEDWKKILLNLSGVRRIDSCGIGELVAGVKLGKRFDSTVKLVNISQQVGEILDLTRLLPMLEVHETEAEALKAFASL
jgi:anti-sigma B factor antagonist